MSEIILTFQTQLSGVMETVFKAAIFEITRLVEDSFLEEVSRSREQVESLKKKLQWSESKGRRRCAECGNNKLSGEERRDKSTSAQTGVENARILKQERITEESWRSCGVEKAVELSGMVESENESRPVNTAEPVVQEKEKLDCMLKSEAVHTAPASQIQEEWKLSGEVAEGSDNSAHSKTYSEQELQQIQNDWSSGLDQAPEPETDMDHIQGLLYRSRYNMEDLGSYSNQELDLGGMNGLTDPPQRGGEVLGFGVLAGSLQTDLGTSEECRRQLKNKQGNKGSPSLHNTSDTGNMGCLLINEDGYLQDVSGLSQAPGATPGDSQGHQIYNRDAVNDNTDCFYSGEAFSQPLELNNGPAGMLAENREDREHACTQCMISFPDQVSLKAHLNGHRHRNITTSYLCNQCGKKFPQACNLKVHQRVHQREGLHLCSHCGKGYTSFSDLRRHRCSQAGDKPYSCSLCGNKFSRLWNLKLHRRIHTQEKPHRCSMCDKSFTRADILKVHQRTHTGERPYSCRVCGLTFKRLDHLRSHQRKHGANLNNQQNYASVCVCVCESQESFPLGRSRMSDSLLLTFQTQLSGVMETVLRSAICEITRLVEGSFLEEIGRGKQEAEVLRRRLQIVETKLGERERVKRVRCTDCGRTGLSKKDTGVRDPRRHRDGVELICVTKQEGVSEAGRRVCEKGSGTPGQEATSTIPDPELKTQVDEAIVGGLMKEEVADIYPHCPTTADHRVSQSHNAGEISGIHTSQPEHWLPQGDKLPSTSAGNQDSLKQRAQAKKPDSKMEHLIQTAHPQSELTGPASSSVSPTVNQQAGTPESMATIKQEVVVVLPPEWEELDRARTGTTSTASRVSQVREELQHRDTLPTGTSEERHMVYPGTCGKESQSSQVTQQLRMLVKKQPKPAENVNVLASSSPTINVSRGHSLHKSPPLPKPSQALPQLQRSYTDERAVTALQTGRNIPQMVGIRTHGHVGHHLVRTPHICSQCGKGFSHLCHLRAHQQIHTGERQFCCTLCGRSFTKLSNLKAHRRVHTGERPYICMDCGKRFTQKCNLKRHQRIHSAHL
ncbi:zinc finger protein 252 [Tachysurus vachellii]|nr:zinc finger protein 252 [Tachysurus vachellii]